jgi:hypothetical protein
MAEAEALNDEVIMAQQRGQAPTAVAIEEEEEAHDAAGTAAGSGGTSATDAVMGSLFGGVWSWMSGQDLLEEQPQPLPQQPQQQ